MNRRIAMAIASVAGLVMLVSAFIRPIQALGEYGTDWFNVLAAVAFVLGGLSLLKMNLMQISARAAGWGYAAVTIAAFLTVLVVGLLKVGTPPADKFPDVAMSGDYNVLGAFAWSYDYVQNPITSTLFALLAFYVASAAFRAFRAKNVEAALLLGTAFIVLLGRVYAGFWLTQLIPEDNPWLAWMRIERLSEIIMSTFANAGTRAMVIGIAIGVAATSLKILVGLDRSYLGSGD